MTAGWRTLGTCALAALVAAACSTDASPPAAIAISAGDAQQDATGVPLPDSIVFLVTGADGQPYRGASVTFAASDGGAASPATATSDAAGRAATRWTLGTAEGAQTLTATIVNGSATATATAFNPCNIVKAYTLGQTVNDNLSTRDCVIVQAGRFFTDFFGLTLGGPTPARYALVSTAFDTYLEMYDVTNRPVAVNDDVADGNVNSGFTLIAAPAMYQLWPSSFDTARTGAYTLSSSLTAESAEGCETIWITRSVTTAQSITSGDCAESAARTDEFLLALGAGQSAIVRQQSGAFDAFLSIFRADTGTAAVTLTDDNGGGGTDAQLTISANRTLLFVVIPGTKVAGQTGAYALSIQAGAGGPGGSAAPLSDAERRAEARELRTQLARYRALRGR